MPHLHWLLPGQPRTINDLKQSNLASVRLRAAVALSGLLNSQFDISMGEDVSRQCTILTVGKIGGDDIQRRAAKWIDQISTAKASKALICLDYTDHHLGFESTMSAFYREVLRLVDVCICPSSTMAGLLRHHWQGPIRIIQDAIEIALQVPKQVLGSPITALWFGHASNVGYLKQFLEASFRPVERIRIIALTNDAGAQWFLRAAPVLPANVRVELGSWSVQNMLQASKYSDLCLIPSDPQDLRKAGVSSNRLITALALGLPTAADMLKAYAEFSDYFVDIRSKRLTALIADPLMQRESVVQAQQQVVPRFLSQVLGQQWGELFNGR